jgi:ketosteroid isomerase-like protein
VDASQEVRDAVLRFYDALRAGDATDFDDLVSPDAATVFIGSAPGEWVTDRDQLRAGFRPPGVRIEDTDPQAWSEGSMGWAVDRPAMIFGGDPVRTRLTSVWRHEDGGWRMVHMHVSLGVPDRQAAELQRSWDAAARPSGAGGS